uniref:Nucleotide-sugar transporter n=1 Tax=Tetraselmis sp. GSL018 TaxID=582737 RepID=A0A061RYD9_9CHLO
MQAPVTYSVPAPAPPGARTRDYTHKAAAVASAYALPKEQARASAFRLLRIVLVCSDCVLIGLQPILVHLSKDDTGHFAFNPVTVNLMTEVVKCIFAIGLLMFLGTGQPGRPMYRSLRSFLRDANHNRLLMVPAGLYACNNYLKFLMQLYFKPTTTKMLGNLKIFVIALLLKTLMNRKFTVVQWEALFLLVSGITINQLSTCSDEGAAPLAPAAILYTGLSVTVPATASVYNEMALKRHMDTSVHLQNFFLYFYGLAFNAAGLLLVASLEGRSLWGMFVGHNAFSALLVVNNAAQGILSSFFFKYADTILKKYSSTVATIFTGIMSMVLFSHPITLNFAIGVSIVFVSMHQFFSFGPEKAPPGGGHPKAGGSPLHHEFGSMDHIAAYQNGAMGSTADSAALASSVRGKEGSTLLPR